MQTSRTQYYAASSLDGFISTEDDGLEWLLQFEGFESSYPTFIAEVGAIAMGSATYEWLLRNLVRPGTEREQPWPYTQPTWVFTHRQLPTMHGAELHFVAGDVRQVHSKMIAAAGDKNVWIVGGGDLAGQFLDHGLLDEIIVQITSVTLGSGKPLLPRAIQKPSLKLVSVTQYGDCFAELKYNVPKATGELS